MCHTVLDAEGTTMAKKKMFCPEGGKGVESRAAGEGVEG